MQSLIKCNKPKNVPKTLALQKYRISNIIINSITITNTAVNNNNNNNNAILLYKHHNIVNIINFNVPKWPAVEWRLEPYDCIADRQDAEKKHREQQCEVEVVGSWRSEHPLVGNIASNDSPAADIHQAEQLKHVDRRKSRRKKRA